MFTPSRSVWGEQLKRDFLEIIKPYLQQNFSRPKFRTPTLLYQATVGTGKTHQMVGLIGHALEHGLRILVPRTNNNASRGHSLQHQ